MTENTTITAPTAAVHELWQSDTPVTGDYARDCCELAREALAHVGFTGFEETPFEDAIACKDGDVAVVAAVVPLPAEMWETSLGDLQGMVDDEVRAKGAALCVSHAVCSDGPLPERLRFDVMSVCVNLEVGRVRVHHVRGAWQS